jgi:hypothetical protein
MKLLCVVVVLLVGPASAWAQPVFRSSIRCEDQSLPVTTPVNAVFAGAGNSQIVALAAGKQVRVFRWILQSTADVQIKFVYGTGTNCGTGEVTLTDRIDPFSTANRPVDSEELDHPIIAPAAQALCLDASGVATITGYVTFCRE